MNAPGVTRSPLSSADRAVQVARQVEAKRTLDVVASGAGLVLTSPLFIGIAAAIRADSPGPVFFRQVRVGRGGEEFSIHKFRTMRVERPGEKRVAVSAAGDPRVTRVGRVLRRTKLDELPQLIDVLTGRMSLVGPRPEVPQYVAQWDPASRDVILSVRPGITDPASLAGIDEAAELAGAADPERYYVDVLLPRKQAMYVEYVRGATLLGDLRLIASTLRAVVRR